MNKKADITLSKTKDDKLVVTIKEDLSAISCTFHLNVDHVKYTIRAVYPLPEKLWEKTLNLLSSFLNGLINLGLGSLVSGQVVIDLLKGKGKITLKGGREERVIYFDLNDPADWRYIKEALLQELATPEVGEKRRPVIVKLNKLDFAYPTVTEQGVKLVGKVENVPVALTIKVADIVTEDLFDFVRTFNRQVMDVLEPRGIIPTVVEWVINAKNFETYEFFLNGTYLKREKTYYRIHLKDVVIPSPDEIISEIVRKVEEREFTKASSLDKLAVYVSVPGSVVDAIAEGNLTTQLLEDALRQAKEKEIILLLFLDSVEVGRLGGIGLYFFKENANEVASFGTYFGLKPEDVVYVKIDQVEPRVVVDVTPLIKSGKIDIKLEGDQGALKDISRILVDLESPALAGLPTEASVRPFAFVIRGALSEEKLEPISRSEVIKKINDLISGEKKELIITFCRRAPDKGPNVFLVPDVSYVLELGKGELSPQARQLDKAYQVKPSSEIPAKNLGKVINVSTYKSGSTMFYGFTTSDRLYYLAQNYDAFVEEGGKTAFAELYFRHPSLEDLFLRAKFNAILKRFQIKLNAPAVFVIPNKA